MKKNHISDSFLVKSYIEGDERSLESINDISNGYTIYYSKVFDRDLTEDIFQDTFIKVIRTLKLGNYNEEGKFVSWVMRIAHNLVIDHFRKNSRIPKFESNNDFDIFSVLKDNEIDIENKMIKDQILIEVKKQ